MKDVVIVGALRTAIGCFQGALAIYGTGSGLVKFYPIAAGALLMAAGAVSAAEAARRNRLENEE